MSHLLSVLKLQMTLVVAISIVFCSVGSAHAFGEGKPGGTWPQAWPQELEPFRKHAWTWVGGLVMQTIYDIPFANRSEFEAAWPHIQKLKGKGTSITLLRGPRIHVKTARSAGVRIIPPLKTLASGIISVNQIQLVVDGDIVDLNRIRLPADTTIVDRRFNKYQCNK